LFGNTWSPGSQEGTNLISRELEKAKRRLVEIPLFFQTEKESWVFEETL